MGKRNETTRRLVWQAGWYFLHISPERKRERERERETNSPSRLRDCLGDVRFKACRFFSPAMSFFISFWVTVSIFFCVCCAVWFRSSVDRARIHLRDGRIQPRRILFYYYHYYYYYYRVPLDRRWGWRLASVDWHRTETENNDEIDPIPGFYWVLVGFTGFYWVLPSFLLAVVRCWRRLYVNGFYWFSLDFSGLQADSSRSNPFFFQSRNRTKKKTFPRPEWQWGIDHS